MPRDLLEGRQPRDLLAAPEPAPQTPRPRTRTEEVMRQLGLTARAIAGGAAQAVSPFTEPVRFAMNAVLPGNPIGGIEQGTDQLLTRAGVPEPETGLERGIQTASRFVAGTGIGGGISNVAARGLGVAPAAPRPSSTPPTTDQLRQFANQAYQRAEDAGVVISPQSFGQRVSQIAQAVADEGIDPTLHPRATAALNRLTEAASEPLTLKQAETLRRVVKNAAASLQPDERRIARIMTDQLDDFVAKLDPSDVLSGDPSTASQAIKQARSLWSRMSKGEVVEELVERARTRSSQFSGSGFENALRTEFRQLVLNPKRLRMFTQAEQAALKRVANGGPVENVLRMIGKAAPTGIVSGGIGTGVGYALGGPVGAAAIPTAGFLARQGATALTSRNALLASELMRRGGPAATQNFFRETAPIVAGMVGPTNALRIRVTRGAEESEEEPAR